MHVDAAEVNREIEDAECIKDEMFAAMAQVDQAIAARAERRSPSSAPVHTSYSVVHNVTKLPKLSIKHFSGSLTGWSIFWDSYKTAVNDNTSLSATEKFAYLGCFLEGRARDAIAGLALTEVNNGNLYYGIIL